MTQQPVNVAESVGVHCRVPAPQSEAIDSPDMGFAKARFDWFDVI
jgi:hypothetical protein